MAKRSKFKKILLVLDISFAVSLLMLVLGFVLLTRAPKGFEDITVADGNEVSPYLTHEIAPKFWDAFQIGQPFEMTILDKGINDILRRDSAVSGGWPLILGILEVNKPMVNFSLNQLTIMAPIGYGKIKSIITLACSSEFDPAGRMKVNIDSVRAGMVDITTIAMGVAAKVIKDELGLKGQGEFEERLIWAIVNDEYFWPIIDFGDKWLQVKNAELSQGTLELGFEVFEERPELE